MKRLAYCIKYLFWVVFLGLTISLNAQNMIPNGDFNNFNVFEGYDHASKDLENNFVTWEPPTAANPALKFDQDLSHKGDMFVGLHVWGIPNYREYLQTPLNCRLKAGETYVISMMVRLEDDATFRIKELGAFFSDERLKLKSERPLSDKEPQVQFKNKKEIIKYKDNIEGRTHERDKPFDEFIGEKKKWKRVADTFVAAGGETHMIIGNFLDDRATTVDKVSRMSREGRAYYYIDDVKLLPLEFDGDPCLTEESNIFCDGPMFPPNFVPDPSFECVVECPEKMNIDLLKELRNWRQPTAGTPDYYHTCGISMGVPNNIFGTLEAKTGHGYTGMYMVDRDDYREYIYTPLVTALEKDQFYLISAYVALSENSGLAVNSIDFFFADGMVMETDTTNDGVLPVEPHVMSDRSRFYNQTDWMQICGIYRADGGERYLTVGNFLDNTETEMQRIKGNEKNLFGYYFLEDVMVEVATDEVLEKCYRRDEPPKELSDDEFNFIDKDNIENIKFGETHLIKNFMFEFDKWDVLPQFFEELDAIAQLLVDNPSYTIEIQGHTDNIGGTRYNKKLSEKRADAIADYLRDQGVKRRQITTKGFGKSKPIMDNRSLQGQKLNRRVEFIISD